MILEVDQAILDKIALFTVAGKQINRSAANMTQRRGADQKVPEVGLVLERKQLTVDTQLFRPYEKKFVGEGVPFPYTLPDGTVDERYNSYIRSVYPEPVTLQYQLRWWAHDPDTDVALYMQVAKQFPRFFHMEVAGKKVHVERNSAISIDDNQKGVYEKLVRLKVSDVWVEVDQGQSVPSISSVTYEYMLDGTVVQVEQTP